MQSLKREQRNTILEKGFTLVELLITLVVLSIGLLGLAGFQAQMIHANSFSRDMTIATTIGADLLEEAKAAGSLAALVNPSAPVPYGDMDVDGILDPGVIDINGNGTLPYNGRFTCTRTLKDPTGAPSCPVGVTFCTVTVAVFWSDVQQQHQLNFTTVVE